MKWPGQGDSESMWRGELVANGRLKERAMDVRSNESTELASTARLEMPVWGLEALSSIPA